MPQTLTALLPSVVVPIAKASEKPPVCASTQQPESVAIQTIGAVVSVSRTSVRPSWPQRTRCINSIPEIVTARSPEVFEAEHDVHLQFGVAMISVDLVLRVRGRFQRYLFRQKSFCLRIAAVMCPTAIDGHALSIRKHHDKQLSLPDYPAMGGHTGILRGSVRRWLGASQDQGVCRWV